MKDLKDLPPPEKKIAAKVLTETGYASRKVEELTGIDHVSVLRYAEEATPDDLKQFETTFRAIVEQKKNKILYKGLDRIEALIPNETKISEVVKALEYTEGKSESGNNLTQINIGKEMSIEFE